MIDIPADNAALKEFVENWNAPGNPRAALEV